MSDTAFLNVEGGQFRCVLEMRDGSIVGARFPDRISASGFLSPSHSPTLFVSVDSNPSMMAGGGPGSHACLPMQCLWAFGCEGGGIR